MGQGDSPETPQMFQTQIKGRRWVDGAVVQSRPLLRIAPTHVPKPYTFMRLSRSRKPPPTTLILGSTILKTHIDRAPHSKTQFGTIVASQLLRFYTLFTTRPQRLVGPLGRGRGVPPHPLRVTWGLDLVTWTIYLLYKRNPPARHFTSQLKRTKRMLGTLGLVLHP